MNFVIWLVTSVAMYMLSFTEAMLTPLVAIGLSIVIGVVRNATRQQKLAALVVHYTETYGHPPPGFDTDATQVGGAIGAFTGNYAAGGAIGAAVDLARHAWNRRGMAEEQKALHDQITALHAWSPYHGTVLLTGGLVMSAIGIWVIGVLSL